ncbi:MAG: type I glyceraldehyde-3-phosphate dehydrogenase [Gammaproteobacteria bacterium]|nr:MAG: type I glyceraldehyde-3-phosphate dehydrogenase [Gammaproteobacteria bacterium]
MRIAINGYGRIGRCLVWAIHERGLNEKLEIVAINDLADFEVLAHLSKYDSTHGRFDADVQLDGDTLLIDGHPIRIISESDPAKLPWAELDVDLVLECSGKFKKRDLNQQHLDAGAKRVLISYPMAEADLTVVYGVNHQDLEASHRIVSNASCTTNCLAPMAKVLHELVGIEQGIMTTVHAYTNDQNLIDKQHSDLYRARSATQSIIPTKTGATSAVGLVLPELQGKLTGMALRVPTLNVSLVDFHFTAGSDSSVAVINAAMQEAAANELKGVLAYNDQALVSIDFNHHPASSIFDAAQTQVMARQIRVMSWYDNEWGFTNRMLDVAALIDQF